MTDVFLRVKREALKGVDFEEYIFPLPFDRLSYTMPFDEIITLAIGLIGSGGIISLVTAIATKMIETKKSNIKISTTKSGDISIDCTNAKPDEVKELFESILELVNKEDDTVAH